jgi:hypothetical protein
MFGIPDKDSSIGFQASQSYRNGDRGLRGLSRQRTRPPARGDDPGIGHPAALLARGHTVAQPGRRGRSSQRFDPAPLPGTLGRDRPAGKSTRPADRHAARPPRPDPRHLFGAGQARRRSHRPQPNGPRQEGHQVSHRDRWGGRAGRLHRHGGERQRHACLRAAVAGRLCGHGPHPHRVRGQGIRRRRPPRAVPHL